jgi:hypothetical protein
MSLSNTDLYILLLSWRIGLSGLFQLRVNSKIVNVLDSR